MNAAFAAAGLDWVYVAFPAQAGRGGHAVKAARDLGLAGLNVTMPFKADAAWACDELTPAASALGAVNVVTVDPAGRLLGSSTDGPGFVRAVREEGLEPTGRSALVCGAGGAARAIVVALAEAGAHVTVGARRRDAADTAAGLVPGAHGAVLAEVDPGGFDLVVNATPLGMHAGDPLPVDVARIAPSAFVGEVVMKKEMTAFLEAVRERGCRYQIGTDMLFEQIPAYLEFFGFPTTTADVLRSVAQIRY
jgi:shikimate dehydrogenase